MNLLSSAILTQFPEALLHFPQHIVSFTEREAYIVAPEVRVFRAIKRFWWDAGYANILNEVAGKFERGAIEHI